jgi:hypothetical protein
MDSPKPEPTVERDRLTFIRGRPDAICDVCLKPFKEHPAGDRAGVPRHYGRKPFLTRLCDGVLVKLGR